MRLFIIIEITVSSNVSYIVLESIYLAIFINDRVLHAVEQIR